MSLRMIDRAAIEATLDEFDSIGREAFLTKYGYSTATTYVLRRNGRFYDPKAVVGVANRFTPDGQSLRHDQLDASEGIAHLKRLGFEVLPFNGLWWVNQGDTYRAERNGGYVWAPQQIKGGHSVTHHTNVSKLRVGQLVVHHSVNLIRAIGTVAEAPYTATRPAELSGGIWQEEGYLCPVDYFELPEPIPHGDIPDRESNDATPFDVRGVPKQQYLIQVSTSFCFPLLEFLNSRIPNLFDRPVTHPHLENPEERLPKTMDTRNPIIAALRAFKNVVL